MLFPIQNHRPLLQKQIRRLRMRNRRLTEKERRGEKLGFGALRRYLEVVADEAMIMAEVNPISCSGLNVDSVMWKMMEDIWRENGNNTKQISVQKILGLRPHEHILFLYNKITNNHVFKQLVKNRK